MLNNAHLQYYESLTVSESIREIYIITLPGNKNEMAGHRKPLSKLQ